METMIPSAGLCRKSQYIQLDRTKAAKTGLGVCSGTSEEQLDLGQPLSSNVLLQATCVNCAHPWCTQVGLLDVGAARNSQAFVK